MSTCVYCIYITTLVTNWCKIDIKKKGFYLLAAGGGSSIISEIRIIALDGAGRAPAPVGSPSSMHDDAYQQAKQQSSSSSWKGGRWPADDGDAYFVHAAREG